MVIVSIHTTVLFRYGVPASPVPCGIHVTPAWPSKRVNLAFTALLQRLCQFLSAVAEQSYVHSVPDMYVSQDSVVVCARGQLPPQAPIGSSHALGQHQYRREAALQRRVL